MKHFGLIVATVVTVLIAAVVFARAGRADAPADPPSPAPATTPGEGGDALAGPAGWHYRHGQPTHWRSCLLRP